MPRIHEIADVPDEFKAQFEQVFGGEVGKGTVTPRLTVFGGGYPITIDGQVVGGIGVSGRHYTQDMKVAEAGIAALQKAL